ncbi:helix-turn-helix domain-containing protein [Clostridium coskatii]|uniref:DNA-binding transcriptional repressor PuuR n=1 Tax=Clostridium coskatii TaxID=1705578 RepID=A0A166U1Q6_9CLOT|nr:XRE family transcriptional regulator [Clostridium coskatii]OAA94457.1 DNA-binding transcriptional repressor PuuR [Clostridium coskatii]OBR93201.1 HTH-type transcriptional repressor RghR [Clostridium coskatii]
MNLNNIIASNLKKLRSDKKLSLSNLSELSGVSKVMIGQIERGQSNPTINTIWKLANGLKVPYTALIDEPKSKTTLVKKEDTINQCSEDGKYRVYCHFSTQNERNFELFRVELDTASSYTSNSHGEDEYEYILVFDGELTLETDNKTYLLSPGDSISFDASKTHTYINNSNEMIKMTILNYYPMNLKYYLP